MWVIYAEQQRLHGEQYGPLNLCGPFVKKNDAMKTLYTHTQNLSRWPNSSW